jgi:hypothetical protein
MHFQWPTWFRVVNSFWALWKNYLSFLSLLFDFLPHSFCWIWAISCFCSCFCGRWMSSLIFYSCKMCAVRRSSISRLRFLFEVGFVFASCSPRWEVRSQHTLRCSFSSWISLFGLGLCSVSIAHLISFLLSLDFAAVSRQGTVVAFVGGLGFSSAPASSRSASILPREQG